MGVSFGLVPPYRAVLVPNLPCAKCGTAGQGGAVSGVCNTCYALGFSGPMAPQPAPVLHRQARVGVVLRRLLAMRKLAKR